MVLAVGVVAGLLAGMVRARLRGLPLQPPQLQLLWLVGIAFPLQLFAFFLPATRDLLADWMAAVVLVTSQLFVLIFAWSNRHQPGGWFLVSGVLLNVLVITLNGGLMPISPETVTRLAPHAPPGSWELGSRLWFGKDMVMSTDSTRLWWLSDCLLLPAWSPYQVAFSLGDVIMTGGAFWLLFKMGKAGPVY